MSQEDEHGYSDYSGDSDQNLADQMEQMDIDVDEKVDCPHCRTSHTNISGLRIFISHECPLCCNDSQENYSLPCGHVYCSVCFVKLGGKIQGVCGASGSSDSQGAARNVNEPIAWLFPHHSELTYERNKGRQLMPAEERNKKQTYDRQMKLMQLLRDGKLDNNGLKDILFYIDERDDMSATLTRTIGWDLRGEGFREKFDNHFKIYLGTHVSRTFLSPCHVMYEICRNSNDAYNESLESHYQSLAHLDWKDSLSDLIYRYNNNCYTTVTMNTDESCKYYCLKGHHFVSHCAHWMCINPLYRMKCKDCIVCVPIEPTHLL